MSHLAHRRDNRHHNLAGEVIGPSVLQPSQSFPYRPRIPSNNYNNISSTRGDLSTRSPVPHYPPFPPSIPKMPSPPSGGGLFRKFRSSTWDSAGMHQRMSPTTSMLIRSSSDSTDLNVSPDTAAISDNKNSVNLSGRIGGNFSDIATMEMVEDSLSEHSSDVEEGTSCDMMNRSLHSSVHDDMQHEEKYLLPTCQNNDVSFASDQAVDLNDLVVSKSVTFLEGVHDNNELLPTALQWEGSNSENEGSDVLASPSSHLGSHSTINRQSSFSREKNKLNPFGNLSYSLIGSFIVRCAPCFWCSKKLGTSPTDREILLRLNLLCTFFCATQFIIGILSFVYRYTGYTKDIADAKKSGTEESLVIQPLVSIDMWSLQTFVYTLSLLSAVLGIGSMFAQRSIREVNLVGSGETHIYNYHS